MPTKKKAKASPKNGSAWLLETFGPLTVGGILNAIRLGDELTQAEFAAKLGITRSHLCDIEKGRRLVGPARAARWGKQLGYGDWLFVKCALEDLLRQEGVKLKVTVEAA